MPPYPDHHGIGQRRLAEIHLEIARKGMANEWFDAFTLGYVNNKWRSMKRRLFASARGDYEFAKAVLECQS